MKPGTTLLIRHEGFIPNQIRLHMKLFGRQMRKDYFPQENHAETVVLFKGHLMSVGARKGGAELTPLSEYLKQHPHYKALIPVVDLSQEEIQAQEAYTQEICFDNKRKYQFGMFADWIMFLKLRLSIMGKSDKKVYCFELAGRYANLVGRWGKWEEPISIYDFYENEHFKFE